MPCERMDSVAASMQSRLSIPVMSVAVFLFPLLLRSAHSRQIQPGAREQKILLIQQLIQEHDLQTARHALAEAANQYPGDAGFDNLLGIVEAQQGDHVAAEIRPRRPSATAREARVGYRKLGPH